jgi:hypothetical protein
LASNLPVPLTPDKPVWFEEIAGQGSVYLFPSFEDEDESERHLEDIFDEIFCNELTDWCQDESKWPEQRTFDMFLEWFDVVHDACVFDTVTGSIRKET